MILYKMLMVSFNNNRTSAASEAGSAYHSEAPGFLSAFVGFALLNLEISM